MRIIAYYLPQFHEIEENNSLWGKGFTEWTNVKKARPFFPWHDQPVEPLDDNYYNLLDESVFKWQISLAKRYGIYGFCFYHYWYNGHKLLEKPIEAFLKNDELDIPFCLCWANHDWTTSWADGNFKLIFRQDYTDKEEWAEHFYYLLPFMKDRRYIKNNNKPLLVIYEAVGDKNLKKMLKLWQDLARQNGFDGLEFAYQSYMADSILGYSTKDFSYDIEYQPQYFRELLQHKNVVFKNTLRYYAKKVFPKQLLKKRKKNRVQIRNGPTVVDYKDVWESILKAKPTKKNCIPGAFVRMDTTPRIQERGFITKGMTPVLFQGYLTKLIEKAKKLYPTDMIFIFAWNEWAEGGYLEPDKSTGYGVLESIRNALIDSGELIE